MNTPPVSPIPLGVVAVPALYDLAAWVGVLAVERWLHRRAPAPCPACGAFTHPEMGGECVALPLIQYLVVQAEITKPVPPGTLEKAQARGRKTRKALSENTT